MDHTFVKGDKVQYTGSSVLPTDVGGDFRAEVIKTTLLGADIRFVSTGYSCYASSKNLRLLSDMPPSPPADERGGGMKFDAGKPRVGLLFDGMPRALGAVADVLTFGAQKYAAHSWKTVPNGSERYQDAQYRHQLARHRGEEHDPETRLLHRAHEVCNALFLLELELETIEKNQRDLDRVLNAKPQA